MKSVRKWQLSATKTQGSEVYAKLHAVKRIVNDVMDQSLCYSNKVLCYYLKMEWKNKSRKDWLRSQNDTTMNYFVNHIFSRFHSTLNSPTRSFYLIVGWRCRRCWRVAVASSLGTACTSCWVMCVGPVVWYERQNGLGHSWVQTGVVLWAGNARRGVGDARGRFLGPGKWHTRMLVCINSQAVKEFDVMFIRDQKFAI